MLDITPPVLVIVCWTLLLAQVLGDQCRRKYPPETDGVDAIPKAETIHECAYGCCYKYSYPCCDPPFPEPPPFSSPPTPRPALEVITPSALFDSYAGTAFIITVGCSAIVPLVMGVTLCLLMRSRKRQRRERQARREERRRQRQTQRAAQENDIFFTSGEHGPQVMLRPPNYASSNPISPPAYSEVAAESPPTTTSPQSPGSAPVLLPPPPLYTPSDNNYTTTITITTTDNNNNNDNNNGGNSSSSDSDESDKGGDNNINITT